MKRRREHIECESREGGRGCIILGTSVCTFKRKEQRPWAVMRKWIRNIMTVNTALCCFILAILVAIAMKTTGIATDFGAYLAPTPEPGTVLLFSRLNSMV